MASEVSKPDFSYQWASGGAIVTPSSVKMQTGWTAEVPPFQWENYLQNRQDNAILHLFQKGISEWDSLSNYYFTASGVRSYVQGSDGQIYVAVQDSLGQNPTTDLSDTYWKVAFAAGDAGYLTQANGDARYLQRTSNLSDLGNTSIARSNLSVYSTAQTDSAIALAPSIQGMFTNLALSSTGLSALVAVTADSLTVGSGGVNTKTLLSVNLPSISLAASGLNGLDTGVSAQNTWYSVWVIWNGTTVAGLLSLSTTSPTMPAGYTYKARVGWVRSDGTANKFPLYFDQHGRKITQTPKAGSNVPGNIVMAQGVQGTISGAGTTVSVDSFIPPTAWAVEVFVSTQSGSGGTVQVGRQGTLLNSVVLSITNESNQAASALIGLDGTSRSVVFASSLTAGVLGSRGWEDNL